MRIEREETRGGRGFKTRGVGPPWSGGRRMDTVREETKRLITKAIVIVRTLAIGKKRKIYCSREE